MDSQLSQGSHSPSVSSNSLPLGRRGSHSSMATTQTERESMNAALDNYHNAAYQSESLTLFNEFTSPPDPAATSDEKAFSEELQGGLSGLYSRFRTSVGGVRDIVSGGGKSTDKSATETATIKGPSSERLIARPVSDLATSSADYSPSQPNSSQGSRLHSPVVPDFQTHQDLVQQSNVGKRSRISSKSGSISSKTSVSPFPGIKPSIASLTKATGSAIVADPAVSQLHVNVIGNPDRSRSSSVNGPFQGNQNAESTSIGSKEGPLDLSMSQTSSSLSQNLSSSPVLSVKMHDSHHEEFNSKDSLFSASYTPDNQSRKSISTPDQQTLPENSSQSANMQYHKQSEPVQDQISQRSGERSKLRISFPPEEPNASVSASTSLSTLSSHNEAPYAAESLPTNIETNIPRDSANANESSKVTAPGRSNEESTSSNRAARLPGYVISRASTAETTTTVSSLPPLNTEFDRPTGQSLQARRQPPAGGDGVLSQLRSKLLSRDFWMRDENAKDCFHCGEPFTTFRRKHHCRICGQIFDSKCTLLISGTRFGQPGSIRVCKPCEKMINAHDDDSSEFSDSEQSPIVANPRVSELSWTNTGRTSADDDDSSSVVSQSIGHVLRTPTMAIPATRRAGEGHNRRSAILEIDSDRPLARPTSSRSLRSSLGGRPHSISHKRHHSRQQYIRGFKPYHEDRAPFQRRHADDIDAESRLPAFHKDNIIDPDIAQYLSDDASSGDEQPSLLSAVSEGALSKSGGENERASFGGLLAAMKKGRSAFGDRSTPSMNRDADEASITSSRAVNLPRFSRRRNMSVTSSYQPRHSPRTSKDNMFAHDTSVPAISLPENTKQVGFKMTRSSSMRGTDAPPVELNKASLEHVRKLLHQLLVESAVPNGDSWENALMPILLKAADEVDPDVQKGDDMDIRHYVKLKKIPGGRPSDTSYVSGLVFTKNLALKGMSRNILRPNILIITFPLEYARQQQHFMSLEPVIRQEREFLENLVSRISALHPNLLLVEKTVSGLALGLLEQAGIATAYNVKPSVLEAVSRCTQTRIMTSMDKLLTTTLHSECSSFDVKTYVHNGRKKTYMYISGCPKELGCTIILRGGDDQVLGNVKRITEFMIYVVYNLRLETNLMRDEFGRISTSPTEESTIVPDKDKKFNSQIITHEGDAHLIDQCTVQQGTNEKLGDNSDSRILVDADAAKVPDNIPMPTYYNDMIKDYNTKILSASPFVRFEPPYLLTRAREMERRLSYLKSLRDQDRNSDQITDEKVKPQKFVLVTPEMVHQSPQDAPAKVKEVLHAAHEAEYDRALYHHQTQKRQWEAYVAGNPNMFDPYAHQNLVILYSLVCTTTSVPCLGPDTFALEFYNEHGDDTIFESDLTIGQYVEDLCHTANSVCTVNGCEKRMFEHHRQYVHGEAQISILVQPYPSKLRGLHNSVLMWSCCKICGNETQVMPMSQNTWKYSFGKYLELSFWGRHLLARTGGCSHDLRRDYFHYFGYRDLALRVQYDPIRLLEIIVPRPRVTWKVDNDLKLRNEVYLRTEQRISKFMASVQDRLKRINVESVVPELLESCKTEIETLIKKGHEDHSSLVRYLQDKYTSSSYWEIIPLNEVLRAVQEKVVEWDMTFADFEMNFFPSEKDIKHMATLQLKKIFLDKDATSVSTDDALQTPTDVEDENNQEADRPRMMRRMTLSPEKAQNVLVSVVEEHAGKKHREELQEDQLPSSPPSAEEGILSVDEASGTRSSPQDEAVSQEEVRHLDLAVPTGQSERSSVGNAGISNQSPPNTSIPMMIPGDGSSESSLPEISEIPDQGTQNGTEDSGASDMPSTPVRRPSAIPRPTEPAFRRTGKVRSPPLVRAQSQPANLPRTSHNIQLPGLKLAFTHPIDPEKSAGQSSTKSSDRKLSDRLGLSSLKSARFASGHSLIPRSAPGKKGISQVSNLARHFEQLSREFEKERQRERRQRAAKGTQSRAFPLASSKPIVEVYRNVREAVEEREPPVDSDESLPSAPQISMDDLSRKSDELTRDDITHDEPSLPNVSPPAPMEDDSALCPDNQLLSGGEADDHQSDEDQSMVEDLHPVDSHEETKNSAEDDSIDFKELPKHERNTLLKILTNFWSERSASGWASLDYPLSVMDHVFADCNIIVREDEPSSLVAFALDSSDYKEKLSSIQQRFDEVEENKPEGDDLEAAKEARVEHALLRPTGTHLKYQFQEGQAKMLCKVFYAEQFDALRKKCGVADRIVESLSRCAKWDSKGGKTKSLFLKTLDDRFILKSLSPIETQAFLKFAPAYFQIMSEALFHELPSAIAKMFGFYQVIIKNPVTGTEFNWFLLLMENLFYDRVPTRIFDLKGSMRNRKVESTGERDEVLLDENMVDFIYETPLFAREHSKKLLGQSVWNDTLFLGRQDVMDYSLMIAIDESRNELVVGIIDCIRTYTWDKKLESWIKDKGFAGGGRNRPTVTSPREYKGRFREAMARYVLQAPSCWHQFQPNAMYRYENQPTEAETVDGHGFLEDAGY